MFLRACSWHRQRYVILLVSEIRSQELAVSDWNSKTCLMQDSSMVITPQGWRNIYCAVSISMDREDGR